MSSAGKPGRPRSEFACRYQVRCTPEQLNAWREAAEREGREFQNWIRWTLDKAARKR